MQPDPHPEIGGHTDRCTCHSFALISAVMNPPPPTADPPEHDGLTAQDAAPLVDKEIA